MNRPLKTIVAVTLIGVTLAFLSCNGKTQSGKINGHSYVDLGLPSGTLWATCNIGAKSPQKDGDYFAWGETVPKTNYSWSSYKYGIDENKLKKYCGIKSFGVNGFVDNLNKLESSDDAATVKWGKGWRTPTFEEWMELRKCCGHVWTTFKGVNGLLFIATNGKQLFLPAAGCCYDENLAIAKDRVGHNMANSLYVNHPNFAWGFFFDSSGCTIDEIQGRKSRYFGVSIRPVHSAE